MEYGQAYKLFTFVLICSAMSQLAACSKTVRWEEEVALNTGEVIWIRRAEKYTIQGTAGNPFDAGYHPARGGSVTEFTWKSKTYKFDLDVGVVLIAISPQGYPVLVSEGDYWNLIGQYPCTTPLYIQFMPDVSGKSWTWLTKIEPWLFNLETNRLFEIPSPEEPKRRYTIAEREIRNAPGLVNSRSRRKINPAHTGDLCK